MTGLPYAAPLSAVDHVEFEPAGDGLSVRARKAVVADDPYIEGHFPGFPIYPGVFVLETVRQAAATALGDHAGRWPDLRVLTSVRFRAPLVPGDELTAEVSLTPCGTGYAFTARCLRQDGTEAARLSGELGYPEPADA